MLKISDIEALNKRSRAKWSQAWLIDSLINLQSPFQQKYLATKSCCDMLIKSGDRITSRYCGYRWCKICCKISTGKLLNHYSPILAKTPDLQLLTLTIPNVKAEKLRQKIKQMIAACRKIQEDRRKKKLLRIKGIRKLECTFNFRENTYHPHFHFIISGENEAKEFLKAWMEIFPEADRKGQDLRPCNGYKEVFKYFTKFTSKTGADPTTGKADQMHFPQALDEIFRAIQGIRIIQPFGINKISEEVTPEDAIQDEKLTEYSNGIYYWSRNFWINLDSAEFLGYFEPDPQKVKFYRKIAYFCTS